MARQSFNITLRVRGDIEKQHLVDDAFLAELTAVLERRHLMHHSTYIETTWTDSIDQVSDAELAKVAA